MGTDAFIRAFVASPKGCGVTDGQGWMSLRSRGLVPSDGERTSSKNPDGSAAIVEIQRRLDRWVDQRLVGGEREPESITGKGFYGSIGKSPR